MLPVVPGTPLAQPAGPEAGPLRDAVRGLANYVINAVLVEGRSVKEVCDAQRMSRSRPYELIARYR